MAGNMRLSFAPRVRAAGHYLGVPGYWLVLIAGILSMLSALQANLFAASRVAQTMAKDRTLFRSLEGMSEHYATPVSAILITSAIVIAILIVLPDVAAAGAASSLIFLVTFALAHVIAYLARIRCDADHIFFYNPPGTILRSET